MLSLFLAPLPWLDGPCDDLRYPVMDGDWVVGCGPSGDVDRAMNLASGERVILDAGATAPAVGGGVVYAAGLRGGLWRLPSAASDPDMARIPVTGHAPPATDGSFVVVVTSTDVQRLEIGERTRYHTAASPAPWYAPAVSGRWAAWVDVAERDARGEDVLVYDADTRQTLQVAVGPGNERHVALSGDHVGWVEDGAVVVRDLRTGHQQRHATDARPTTRLALDGDVACWESWNGLDVDVTCSDGVAVEGDGDQRTPSRSGDRVLYVERGRTFLATVER